jgi:hypothetical protein
MRGTVHLFIYAPVIAFSMFTNRPMSEALLHELESFAEAYASYETDATTAVVEIERRSFNSIRDGRKSLEKARANLAKLDSLIAQCLSAFPLSVPLQERFTQAIVSLRPRLSAVVYELNEKITCPPKKSPDQDGDSSDDTEPVADGNEQLP